MNARNVPQVALGAALSAALLLSDPAWAHHPMGGTAPTTLMQGLLSGIGHPIIGIDHLAFIVGIGLLAAIAGYGMLLPVLFVIAMTAGIGLHLAALTIPHVELLIAGSVVLIGLALTRPRSRRGPWLEGAAFALAGLLHGYAFAEAAIGAETTPLMAYIAGLVVTQLLVAFAAYTLGRSGEASQPLMSPVMVRVAGAAILVIGSGFAVIGSGLVG